MKQFVFSLMLVGVAEPKTKDPTPSKDPAVTIVDICESIHHSQEHSACLYGCHAGVVMMGAEFEQDAIIAAIHQCQEMCQL